MSVKLILICSLLLLLPLLLSADQSCPFPTNCELCTDATTTCTKCKSGYFLNSTNNSCNPCGTNCVSCADSTNCTTCNSTNFLKNGSCITCPENCVNCSDNICLSCKTGFIKMNDSASDPCTGTNGSNTTNNTNITCPANCSNCSSNTNCTFCNENFFLNLTNGSCDTCPQNCFNCSKSICDTCKSGFFKLNNNTADPCTGSGNETNVTCPVNCANCSNSTTCTLCKNEFFLANSSCVTCPSNCLNCSNNTCFSCKSGFRKLNVSDPCTGASVPCPVNCDNCTDGGSCSTCHSGFFLNASNNSCEVCQTNCSNCSSKNVCLVCTNNTIPDKNGACVECGSNATDCLSCPNSSICTSCKNGSTLVNSTCYKCDEGCESCSNSTSSCTKCLSGYFLSNSSTCQKCSGGCATCNSSTACSECLPSYNLSNGSCISSKCNQSLPYLLYNDNATCVTCNGTDYHVIDSATCVFLPPGSFILPSQPAFDMQLQVSCPNASKLYFAYGLYDSAKLTLPELKKKVKDGRTVDDKLYWLQLKAVDLAGNTSNKTNGTYPLAGIKNSGEKYSYAQYCEIGYYANNQTGNFISKSNGAQALSIQLTSSSLLNTVQKIQCATGIGKALNTTNSSIYTDEGVLGNAVAARLLQTADSKYFILPDYALNVSDPNIDKYNEYINANKNSFVESVTSKAAINGITFSNPVSAKTNETLQPAPTIPDDYPKITINSDSISVILKQDVAGTIFIAWQVLPTLTNSNNSTMNNETFTNSPEYKSNSLQRNMIATNTGDEKTFQIGNLTIQQSVKFFYWGENMGMPRLRTLVYSKIVSTTFLVRMSVVIWGLALMMVAVIWM